MKIAIIAIILIIIGTIVYNSKSRTLSIEDFRNTLAEKIKKTCKGVKIEFSNQVDEIIVIANDSRKSIFVDNAYGTYKQSPKDLNEILDQYAASAAASLSENEKIELDTILPVIKDSSYYSETKATLRQKGMNVEKYNPLRFNLNKYLDIYIVSDSTHNMKYLNEESLEDMKKTKDELLIIAKENLSKKFNPEVLGNTGTFMLRVDGNYEASMILNESLMKKIERMVDGQLVMIIPSRDVVLLTGTNNKEKIQEISKNVCGKLDQYSYYICDKWMIYKNNTIESWE